MSSSNALYSKTDLGSDCPSKCDTECRSECPPANLPSENGPVLAYLELTPACNSRCLGCINESFIADYSTRAIEPAFHQPPLKAQEWLSLLNRLPKSINSVILSGGEPSLHPEFLSIIDGLEARGVKHTIFSNGRWPNPNKIVSQLKNSDHFGGFLISLHGSTPKTHEGYMGVIGIFDNILSNIRQATEAGLPVTISTVLTQENIREIQDLPNLAIELGAKSISFNRYLITPDRVNSLANQVKPLNPIQLQEAISLIESLRKKYQQELLFSYGPTIPQCFSSSSSRGCSAGEAAFVVDPWGNLKPCLHSNFLCGNLLADEFTNLWDNDSFQMWRQLTPSECTSCSVFSSCGGGCKAMNLTWKIGRDPLMLEPLIELEMLSSNV